jgi:putative N6-adenine-specific DNA methylase
VSSTGSVVSGRWVATCARGLEEILLGELRALDLADAGVDVGGVRFRGDFAAGMRANWRLRSANRVLLELASWPAPDDEALYAGARTLDHPWLTPDRTFAIHATSSRSQVRDTRWVALKVKDGLVDGQRERFGRRASVERDWPDLALRVRLHGDRATLLLDTSGEPLDRRGYRTETTTAPLREQVAAAAILASGWDGRGPVVDPMCGSGTLLAEAAAIALGLPPNRLREVWAFEQLPGFDPAVFARVRAEPIPAPGPEVELWGVDREPSAIAAATRNLEAAGLHGRARLAAGDGFAFEPPAGPGLLAVNPPWGQRLTDTDIAAWRRLGDLLKQRYRGWKAVVLAGGEGLGKHLGLRPARRLPVRSGPLDARILLFDLW